MNTYVIDDETDNYSFDNVQKTNNKKYLIIAIAIIVVLVFIIIIKNLPNKNSYSSYENEMVSQARNYVASRGISTSKEIYIDASKINVELPNNCSMLSGVIYNGSEYKPYLLCDNYESKIINNSDNIKLKGNEVMVLLQGTNYYELGVLGNTNVSISGHVMDTEGVYNVYYIPDAGNYMIIRKVIVVNNPTLINKLPIMNVDSQELTLNIGNRYYDDVTAFDIVDGDLTKNIIKISNIDETTPGEYNAIYYVRNSLGYITTVNKKVLVIDNNSNDITITISLSNENITNQSITAQVKVIGKNYDYIRLPDGTMTKGNNFEYPIDENGKYDFTVVLLDGSEISKALNVTNIDKTIPEGTCKASLYYDHTSVSVNISSSNYIVGYNYYINNKNSGFISSSNYNNTTEKNVNSVYVIAKDYIGNEGKIVCTTEKQSNMNPNGITDVTYHGESKLRIPITSALAKKGYTVNDLNQCIYNRVKEAGPYTRYGVVAAAYGLLDCTYKMTGYVISYNHTSGKVHVDSDTNYCRYNSDICGKLGINTRWGTVGGQCSSSECWHGLNCATFVRWSMCNGGMDLCSSGTAGAHSMTSSTYFPEADGVTIKGKKVTYYSGSNLSNYDVNTILHMIKPGDIMATSEGEGHALVIVGIENDGIYTAENGQYMRNIKFSQITNGKETYRILLLDKYYANPNNRNNLYG